MQSLTEILADVQQIAVEVVRPWAESIDTQARWPEENIRALQQAGLGGLVVPAALGGLGHGLVGLARVCEILGRECGSTGLCFGMHCVGAAVLATKATDEQQRVYLEPICRGEHLTTLALSEPGTGAHFYLAHTRLVDTGHDGFLVQGQKSFVTNGGHADSYVVSTVAADPDAPPGMFSCVVVNRAAPGITWGDPWDGAGMRGNASRSMYLEDVPIPRRDLLGQQGDEIWYVFTVIAPYFLVAMAGTYLGIAAAALDQARDHLTQRRYSHTGASLARQEVLQHRLGTLWARIEATRRLIYHAAELGDSGSPDALPALLSAKAEVADRAVGVVNDALTLVGGIGYQSESGLMRRLRDARAAHIMAPTTDMLRTWTGRALLGLPLLAE